MPTSISSVSLFITSLFLCCTIHVSAQWEYMGSPESSYAIDFDAEGDTILSLTSAGILFSDDDAVSWQRIATPENIHVFNRIDIEEGSIYLSVTNPTIFEGNFTIKTDVWRTDDWGHTWQLITGGIVPTHSLRQLLVSHDTVYHIGFANLYVSFDKGNTFPVFYHFQTPAPESIFLHHGDLYGTTTELLSENDLLRSEDLGQTWIHVYGADFSESIFSVTSVNDTLWKLEQNLLDTFYVVSSSADDGINWTDKDSLPVHDHNLLDALVIGDEDDLFLVREPVLNRFYTSSDNGYTWQQKDLGETFYNALYTQNIFITGNETGIQISHDQGSTFSKSTDGVTAATVVQFAHSGSTIWARANGSMHKYEASNPLWQEEPELKNISNTLDGHLIATIDDIPHHSSDHGITWSPIGPENFDNLFYYPEAGYKAAGNMMYCTTWGDSSFYSQDYGVTWDPIISPRWKYDANVELKYQGGKYLALDHSSNMWVSDDGITWSQLDIQLSEPIILETFHYHPPYYFSSSDSFLLRAHEAELEWELFLPIASGNIIPWFSDISPYHMLNHGNILLSTYYGHGVFASLDQGVSWYHLNTGLDDFQTISLSIIGTDLFLGVDGGVWRRPLSDIAPVVHEGIVFNDANQNGLKDDGETGVYGAPVKKSNQDIVTYSNLQGEFFLYSDNDETDFIEALSPSVHATVTTSPIEVSGSEDSLYFGIYYTPGIYDAVVTITNTSVVRPGFENDFVITYTNAGTVTTDMEIRVVIPDVLEIISSTFPYAIEDDTIVWYVTDIIPGVSGNITLTTRLHPLTTNGSLLEIVAQIPPGLNGDYNPVDNADTLLVIVVSSYDPNDKAVFPSGYITPAMIADTQRLEYTIRFQNTGTYLATFIRIQDTISNHLDLTSLEILSASHPYTWKVLQGGVLEFFFDDINLPDSTSDERGSHGFVKFAINAKPTLALNDQIENKAYIYFDYNIPVVTNTVGSTVGFETRVSEPAKLLSVTATPNPFQNILHISISDHLTKSDILLSLFDTNGKLVKSKTATDPSNLFLQVSNIPPGLYLLKVTTGAQSGSVKVIK